MPMPNPQQALDGLEAVTQDHKLPTPAEGTYQVIIADPPWQYTGYGKTTVWPERHYPTMPHEDIMAMKVPSADDSLLLLWATNPKLDIAFDVLRAWGFSYSTCWTWDKLTPAIGRWLSNQSEQLLICRKGKFPAPLPHQRPPSVMYAPRGKHSEKPDVVHEFVERVWPTATKLEMFARRARQGWTSFGNEVTTYPENKGTQQ